MCKPMKDLDISKEFNKKMQEAAYLYLTKNYKTPSTKDRFIKNLLSHHRKKCIKHAIRTAAIIALILLTGVTSMIWSDNDDVYGGKRIINKGISIMSPLNIEEEIDDDGNVSQVITAYNENDIKALQKHVNEIRKPAYIPEGYSFEKLTARKYSDVTNLEYLYGNTDSKELIVIVMTYYSYDPEITVLGKVYTSDKTGQQMYVAELPDTNEFVITIAEKRYSCSVSGKGNKDTGIRIMESIQNIS